MLGFETIRTLQAQDIRQARQDDPRYVMRKLRKSIE